MTGRPASTSPAPNRRPSGGLAALTTITPVNESGPPRDTRRTTVLMSCAWLFAVACTRPAAAEEGPPAAPSTSARFEHDMMVRFHMHENLGLLRAIEKLLNRGRLDDAKQLARAISDAPDEPGLGPWAAYATTVRDHAARLAAASGLDEACRREAQLAGACSNCHTASGAAPEFRSPGRVPPDESTIEARMARHLWATDRLWEGVVGGADDAWADGLDVLAATPLSSPSFAGPRLSFAGQLHTLADRARQRRKTDGPGDRAQSYGEILVVCAGCHTAAAPSPQSH